MDALLVAAVLSTQPGDLVAMIVTLLGGGLLGGVAVLIKAGAHRDKLEVGAWSEASHTGIEVFQAAITQLRADLADAEKHVAQLRQDLRSAREEVRTMVDHNGQLEVEIVQLRREVRELREQLAA